MGCRHPFNLCMGLIVTLRLAVLAASAAEVSEMSVTRGNCSLTQSVPSLPTLGIAPTSLLPLACAGAADLLNLHHVIKSLGSLLRASTLSLKIGTLCQAQRLSVLSPSTSQWEWKLSCFSSACAGAVGLLWGAG